MYNWQTSTWTAKGNLATARHRHSCITLPDGRVIAAGGYDSTAMGGTGGALNSVEVYTPSTGLWTTFNYPLPYANGNVYASFVQLGGFPTYLAGSVV